MVIAPSLIDLLSSYNADRSKSDRAPALAARTHAAEAVEGRFLGLGLAGTSLDRDRTARPDRGDVEGERAGRADVRSPESAEEDAQHRVRVRGGADRGAGVGA